MAERRVRSHRLATLSRIFRNPAYVVIAVIGAVIFYYLFRYLVAANNYGIFLVTVPVYLVYLLVVTSGILLSISVFSIFHSLASRKAEAAGGIMSVLVPSIGGVVASCGCAFPILGSILLFFGVNSFEAVGIVSAISAVQIWIMLAMLAINVAIIYYYSGRLSVPPRRPRK